MGLQSGRRKWRGSGMCAAFCVSSSVHAEKLFLRAWDQHAEHCRHCPRCVRNSSKFDPWGAIGVEAGPVLADLNSCREKSVSRRKVVKDTRERWFGAETVASSAVAETAPRTTVCISDVVEVEDVQCVEEHDKLGLLCCSRSGSSPGKSKKKRVPAGPGVAKKVFCSISVY